MWIDGVDEIFADMMNSSTYKYKLAYYRGLASGYYRQSMKVTEGEAADNFSNGLIAGLGISRREFKIEMAKISKMARLEILAEITLINRIKALIREVKGNRSKYTTGRVQNVV